MHPLLAIPSEITIGHGPLHRMHAADSRAALGCQKRKPRGAWSSTGPLRVLRDQREIIYSAEASCGGRA